MDFLELNADQRRETVNSRQRFAAFRDASQRARELRGSMTWSTTKGHDYLVRSAYDKAGRRRQVSLGRRDDTTERIKAEFESARDKAELRLRELRPVMRRQAAVNRALGLGRVPLTGARILRALDAAGLLGSGIRVIGTNALYAYEAVAGALIETDLLTTEDVDLLLDSRGSLFFVASEGVEEASLLRLLQRVDTSFERTRQTFRAVNKDGYLVDLVKPLREPPWTTKYSSVTDPADLAAVEIAGLVWHESAPVFEATVIDVRGDPVRLVTSDPRVFAAHKHWMSRRADREPVKRRRDGAQAKAVAALTATYLPHLSYEGDALRMLPKSVFDAAAPLFVSSEPS